MLVNANANKFFRKCVSAWWESVRALNSAASLVVGRKPRARSMFQVKTIMRLILNKFFFLLKSESDSLYKPPIASSSLFSKVSNLVSKISRKPSNFSKLELSVEFRESSFEGLSSNLCMQCKVYFLGGTKLSTPKKPRFRVSFCWNLWASS